MLVRSSTPVVLMTLGALTLGGCGFLKSLVGRNTIDLEGANVKSMSVDIRKQDKTICPRQPVQMAVFADVILKGDSKVKHLQTWQGNHGANENGKLSFEDFAFHSNQGSFDKDGWFSPNEDLRATLGKEFELKTAYKRRPDKFTFTTTYKPDYRCIHDGGGAGNAGNPGNQGTSGNAGNDGQSGSETQSGGQGSDGTNGSQGGNGSDGSAGPELTAYVTYVKTPFYDKLVAVRIGGGDSDFLLFHPEGHFTIVARGGPGGPGGRGGSGGRGGHGGSGNPGGRGGNGGNGGIGGNGGNGGPGGKVELIVDKNHEDLAQMIQIDVSGGDAGPAGGGGDAGSSGSGGSGIGQNAQSGQSGTAGTSGQGGQPGHAGPDGQKNAHTGDVADAFSGIDGITVL